MNSLLETGNPLTKISDISTGQVTSLRLMEAELQ